MASPEAQLFEYVKQQKAAGISREEIRKALLQSGWSEAAVNVALGPDPSEGPKPRPFLTIAPMRTSSTIGNLLVSLVSVLVIMAALGWLFVYQFPSISGPIIQELKLYIPLPASPAQQKTAPAHIPQTAPVPEVEHTSTEATPTPVVAAPSTTSPGVATSSPKSATSTRQKK